MSAVADEAGVTRVTLYRHFRSMDELFTACMTHWRALHPPPDVERWRAIPGFERRLRTALDELYRWYARNSKDLYPIYRDAAHTPESNQLARRQTNERQADAILADFAVTGASREAPPRRDRPRGALLDVALAGHGPGTVDARGCRVGRGIRPGGEALGCAASLAWTRSAAARECGEGRRGGGGRIGPPRSRAAACARTAPAGGWPRRGAPGARPSRRMPGRGVPRPLGGAWPGASPAPRPRTAGRWSPELRVPVQVCPRSAPGHDCAGWPRGTRRNATIGPGVKAHHPRRVMIRARSATEA